MVNPSGALIREVFPDSIGAELELEPGDRILAINGNQLSDFIDFLSLSADEELILEVRKRSGDLIEIEFEKDPDEPLGLTFEDLIYDQIEECANHCLFCFVHQLPKGQRRSLYVQDDDYRLSFLQGCYITLTNLTEADWERIERLHLSPLYISVHATDSEVRQKLLGSKKAGQILTQLQRLADAGITVHTQAVLCPGINDGSVLERTISDLAGMWPSVASLAIVPVGLTEHRRHLYPLRKFNLQEAEGVLQIIHRFQEDYLKSLGTRFVFAADEWYLQAGKEIPFAEEYEDYPQLDNGVGLIRWFLDDLEENLPELLPELTKIKRNYVIITGYSAKGLWEKVTAIFRDQLPEIHLDILPVANHFFGQTVTVTGLLGGADIAREINQFQSDKDVVFLIPQITLKQGEAVFLDGMSIQDLIGKCSPRKIAFVPTRAREWLQWITEEGF